MITTINGATNNVKKIDTILASIHLTTASGLYTLLTKIRESPVQNIRRDTNNGSLDPSQVWQKRALRRGSH